MLALERRRCPELRAREEAASRGDIWGEDPEYDQAARDVDDSERDIDLEITTISETLAFATVTTPCHDSGAYNVHATLYVETRGVVRLAPFAPPPRWARAHPSQLEFFEPEIARSLWGPQVTQDARGIVLSTIVLARGLGDGGSGAEYVWQGSRFALHALRSRSGGAYAPADTGEFPRTAPPDLRCDGVLEVSRAGNSATLTTHAGPARRVVRFVLSDADCEAHRHTITCGADIIEPMAEYALVTLDDDWVVLRIDDDPHVPEEERARIPRGCAL